MLLNRHRSLRGDRGSTLVTTVLVMLALMLMAMTAAAVVMNTTRTLDSGRDFAQSRAAADAGLVDRVAALTRDGVPCPSDGELTYDDEFGSTPSFKVTVVCDSPGASRLTITSTGDSGSATAKVEAVYEYIPPGPSAQKEPALVTRAPLDLSALKIKSVDPSVPATVWVIPDAGVSGDFTCNSGGAIAGSVYLPAGTVFGAGGCTVGGDVYAEGNVTIGGGTTIRGDLVSLNGNVTVTGGNTIDGSIYAKGNVTGSSLSSNFVQSIHAGGNLSLSGGAPVARDRITYGGTFSYPHSGHDAWAVNSVTKTVVDPPPLPTAPQWEGFTQGDLDALVDSGAFTHVPWTGSCAYSWHPEHEMIGKIKSFTSPTLVDARHCARLDLHQFDGTTTLKTDIIFVAPSFNIEDQEFTSADGKEHRLWFISPEVDGRDCSAVPPITLDGSSMIPGGGNSKISAMIFTQCTVHYPNSGENWQGSIHAGKMTGQPNFWYKPVGFPGQEPPDADDEDPGTPSAALLGNLVSQRDA